MPVADTKTFQPDSATAWRNWLIKNHLRETSVWLIFGKASSGLSSLKYSDAVDEALCFGWIDSVVNRIDDKTYKQYYSRRKPTSIWSAVNKAKVKKLLKENKFYPEGLRVIEVAKQNGSWTILDDVEKLIIPDDLKQAMSKNDKALLYFESLSRTDKRNILQWLVLAKKDETRRKRIEEITSLATVNKKPKQF